MTHRYASRVCTNVGSASDVLASQFLYDVARTTVVTFDDATSIGDKATYAQSAGLAGAFAWSLNQVRAMHF